MKLFTTRAVGSEMAKESDSTRFSDSMPHQYNDLNLKLMSANVYLPFDTDELNKLQNARISTANNLLNQAVTRHNGLKVLLDILPHCPKDILSKYASLWLSKATQVLESSKNRMITVTLACKVLAKLVTLCKDIPEVEKQISMQNIKQWVTIISNCEPDKRNGGMFYLLARLLNEYKESSEKLQAIIRKIVLPPIDSERKNIVQGGANCFTLLARATDRSFKPPSSRPSCTSYVYSQALICNSLHAIMDELFSEIVELDVIDSAAKLEIPNIHEDNVIEYYFKLEKRFANLCIYLSTMLGGCGGKNSASPNDILRLLCRGLAVTPANLSKDESDKKRILFAILPKLHTNLLMVLNAFIDGFEADLLPDATTILRLYIQTLKWTDKVLVNQSTISRCKSFADVRIAVYKSLSMWLTRLKALSYIEFIADDIISQYIFKDIIPEKDRVLLTVQKPQNMSKRAQKRHEESQYANSTALGSATSSTKDPLLNAELCREALTALENIFSNSGSMLKTSLYEATQGLIASLLYDVYRGVDDESFYKKDTNCRLGLLRVLHAVQMNSHPSSLPPTQYSIDICHFAVKDAQAEITREARAFLAHLENIVHPSAPTLQLPVSITQEKQGKQPQMDYGDTMPQNPSSLSVGRVRELFKDVGEVKAQEEHNGGPTPSKQRKLQNGDEEKKAKTPAAGSNHKKPVIVEDTIISGSQKKGRDDKLSQRTETSEGEIYPLTQKEIGDNDEEDCSSSEVDEASQLGKTDQMLDSSTISLVEKSKEATEDTVAEYSEMAGLEYDSGDEAILNLFCDEVKED